MSVPSLHDTIVAVSSAWTASPLGIVRLSGPQAFGCAATLGARAPAQQARPCLREDRLRVDPGLKIPATTYWFFAPRSYTGQDVVELHVPGCLPLLRRICQRLLESGARRALPGEFTSRAFLNGRLAAEQVEGVLHLIHADSLATARQAARRARGEVPDRIQRISDALLDLLARVEAGIDFVDEEDVQFITPAEVREEIERILRDLRSLESASRSALTRARPHVALVGLPNAGKSTLFNALLGFERAIVAPVLGTTRDVLSAEIEIDGMGLVIQDCAGLGAAADDLELAAHRLAEQAAEQADLVLWVHDATQPFSPVEHVACGRIDLRRRVLVLSKMDLAGRTICQPPVPFAGTVRVSAHTGAGLDDLRRHIAAALGRGRGEGGGPLAGDVAAVVAALKRARDLLRDQDDHLHQPELLALELRLAWERVEGARRGPLVEDVLGRIFSRFCIGK